MVITLLITCRGPLVNLPSCNPRYMSSILGYGRVSLPSGLIVTQTSCWHLRKKRMIFDGIFQPASSTACSLDCCGLTWPSKIPPNFCVGTKYIIKDTVDGKNPANQLISIKISHYLYGFIHVRSFFRISF